MIDSSLTHLLVCCTCYDCKVTLYIILIGSWAFLILLCLLSVEIYLFCRKHYLHFKICIFVLYYAVMFTVFLHSKQTAWNCKWPMPQKFLHACCVLTRPFNIHSHRSSFSLSGTNTTNTPRLSSHSPLPPLQQNTILFFFTQPSGVLVCHGGHVWGESSLPIYLWLFPRLSG